MSAALLTLYPTAPMVTGFRPQLQRSEGHIVNYVCGAGFVDKRVDVCVNMIEMESSN